MTQLDERTGAELSFADAHRREQRTQKRHDSGK